MNPPDSADTQRPTFLIHDELFRTAETIPGHPALRFREVALTYREYASAVRSLSAGLRQVGVGRGSRVGLYLPNSLHYAVTFFAVLAAGATVVNLSPLDAPTALEKKMKDSGARWLVSLDTPAFSENARALAACVDALLVLGSTDDFPLGNAAEGSEREADSNLRRYADLLRAQPGDEAAGAMDDLAVLQYTGGTTGDPKGAMLLHRNLAAASHQLVRLLRDCRPPLEFGGERVLLSLPLFHIFAINAGLMLAMRIGAELIIQERFDVTEAIHLMEARKVSIFGGVPTMFTAILEQPDILQHNLRSLKFCTAGGAPLLEETAARFLEMTGVWITDGWGLTESCGMGTLGRLGEPPRSGSCGLPVPGLEVQLRDLDDPEKMAAQGARGQLCIRGPNLMAGYWQKPDATRSAFTSDGFLLTGDVGTRDDDGHIRIVDRLKDMLICGGFNVYPRILEEAILEHPNIEEVCVIGVDDDYRGQSPKAFIKMRAGAEPLSLAELRKFLGSRLGKHEMISFLEVRAALPRTAVGKLSKRALQDEELARSLPGTGSPAFEHEQQGR